MVSNEMNISKSTDSTDNGVFTLSDRLDTHYSDVIMGALASQITSLTIVYSILYSDTDQRKHQSRLRVTGHCAGNSPGTGEFLEQMTSNAENVSIWWRHHAFQEMMFQASVDMEPAETLQGKMMIIAMMDMITVVMRMVVIIAITMTS